MDFSDLNDSLSQFESALSGEKIELEAPAPSVILLALDSSDQDETGIVLCAEIAKRFGAKVTLTHGVDHAESKGLEEATAYCDAVAARLRAEPYLLTVEVIFKEASFAGQQVLAAQQASQADLVVIPAPYLRDLDWIGDGSLSTPVDVLLAECAAPLLIVRQPLDVPEKVFERMVIPMTVNVPALGVAAGWAFEMVHPSGVVELVAIADEEAADAAQKLLSDGEELTVDALLRAENKLCGGMTSALQRKGSETNIRVVVDIAVGKVRRLTLDRVHEAPCIVCTGTLHDRTSATFGRVQHVALGSRYPVLVVRR